jgi:APA family basic amino acid/polyamine antiporter
MKFLGFTIFVFACAMFLMRLSPVESFTPAGFTPALNQPWIASDYWGRFGEPEFLKVLLIQLFFIALSYTGFNASIYIAGEVPSRSVSRSMVLSCILVTATYLVLNTLFLMCDTQESIVAGKDTFVSGVAKNVGGVGLQWVMRITIALSSATSVLAMLAIGPRVIAQMSKDKLLPRVLSGHDPLDSSPSTPRLAIGLQALASCIIVWSASVLQMISYLGLTLTLCGAMATATLWIAYKDMHSRRAIAWWEHLALVVYIGGAMLLIAGAWIVKREQFYLCIGTFLSGLVVYGFATGFQRDSKE